MIGFLAIGWLSVSLIKMLCLFDTNDSIQIKIIFHFVSKKKSFLFVVHFSFNRIVYLWKVHIVWYCFYHCIVCSTFFLIFLSSCVSAGNHQMQCNEESNQKRNTRRMQTKKIIKKGDKFEKIQIDKNETVVSTINPNCSAMCITIF